eukprot:CAMPEP_0206528020 /NCGR_PEP_ID=MMETSP0325_2-20121206/1704_1 /ASSEMBLY_ACC=CAM_ASM_000347 /TAXON_ID=2866 /ORGANISM="Crypthecodinium cohnii, Strain Seligo" /LENGTH=1325 /DNA_ID=CAMNT_0054023559 /DNA_START=157 /DNA_END=4134 /DNA_ORIENTATION=+
MTSLLLAFCVIHTLVFDALGDVYLNNPRGSNNKLNEQNNNAQNQQRLFDSQNNAAAGYQVGDDCRPNCLSNNGKTYERAKDKRKPGAGQGIMTYYAGSELYVEWLLQHGCGVDHPNVLCQIVIQYMCDADTDSLSDGLTFEKNAEDNGNHESEKYYQNCEKRDRNKGLYFADQNRNNKNSAKFTRQDNGGTRYGNECPEERDYYPYWHPTPWHDIAIITHEPQKRCAYYQAESQNVKEKGICMKDDEEQEENNEKDCVAKGKEWQMKKPFDEPAPECLGGIKSRDNHNGNARNGQPMYYTWTIPHHILTRAQKDETQCVLRVRYNITTGDFLPTSQQVTSNNQKAGDDYFFVDHSMNEAQGTAGPNRRRVARSTPVLGGDPVGDMLGLSAGKEDSDTNDYFLQIQVNTDQYGRTFQDRTHVFKVKKRPDSVPSGARIVNYNVRGRRGNIVQVYPSVEYDFVPTELTVEQGDYLHFQWTGADSNNQGNDGNGKQGTDRSNLVQIGDRTSNVPLRLEEHTLLADMRGLEKGSDAYKKGRDLIKRFGFLDQENAERGAPQCATGDTDVNDNADENCKQLNAASAYFDGGVIEMKTIGVHHIVSTRNNDFSNRSHKATITVVRASWTTVFWILIGIASALGLSCCCYGIAAIYALHKPGSWLFSKRYRPRVLNFLSREHIAAKEQERRAIFKAEREALKKAAEVELAESPVGGLRRASQAETTPEVETHSAAPAQKVSWREKVCGGREAGELGYRFYLFLNLIVFGIGFGTHWGGGFQSSIMFPIAKGAGFTLDLNYAMLILPTLKSLQTALRGRSGTSNLRLMDDPIDFHITVAVLTFLGSVVHIAAHLVHIDLIANAPHYQDFKLGMMELTAQEQMGGATWMAQLFNPPRYVALSGVIITVLMILIGFTSMACVRRGSNPITRVLGGFRVFSFFHSSWPLVYILLLAHAPARLWIWFFFPLLFVVIDKVLQSQHHISFAVLKSAHLLPYDVLHLTFDLPQGFTYQAGQYIHLGWRGEWHPFTLTSAPEERQLSLHIRSPETLDWCSALKKHLCFESPAAAGMTFVNFPPTADTHIKFVKCLDLKTGKVYSRPDTGNQERIIGGDDIEDGSFSQDGLPDDAVVLQLSGPFGAPAQRVWEYETVLVVGSGIGVTPFISIIRSVQERARLRALMGDHSVGKKSSARKSLMGSAGDMKTREEIAAEIVPVPYKMYFVWIVRNQEEANWFYDVLSAAIKGPCKEIAEIQIYVTGEQEISTVKRLDCAERQFAGRPNWGRVFKEIKTKHEFDHIGVFLCGSPEIGRQLATQSAAFSDPASVGGCKFSFHKENF